MPAAALDPVLDALYDGLPPRWADAWGEDEHGLWCTIRIKQVVQRLRRIPPGTFLMGSPDSDKEAYSDEKPQHPETIAAGFWIFDTPCTQELWEAVMEAKSRSRFLGPTRPVDQVSWDDCRGFLDRINAQLDGLVLGLPTEAEWEYACRAGSEEPRYGPIDEIAWWRENSRGETHPVAQLRPNDWGLYDMLGNVWEWTASPLTRDYTPEARRNPAASRVSHGGSWGDHARFVRSAFRGDDLPSLRVGRLGFRCSSSGSVASPVRKGAERS